MTEFPNPVTNADIVRATLKTPQFPVRGDFVPTIEKFVETDPIPNLTFGMDHQLFGFELGRRMAEVMDTVAGEDVRLAEEQKQRLSQKDIRMNPDQVRNVERVVIILNGKPVSGKTDRLKKAKEWMRSLMITRWGDLTYFFVMRTGLETIGEWTWEKAMWSARKKGLVTSPEGTPMSATELEGVNSEYSSGLKRTIEQSFVSRIEAPSVTAAHINGQLVGVNRGYLALRDLHLRKRDFADLPPLTIGNFALTGGKNLRFMVLLRDALKKNINMDEPPEIRLLKYQEIMRAFGQPIPKTVKEGDEERAGGASLEQIQRIDDQVFDLAVALWRAGKLQGPPNWTTDRVGTADPDKYEATERARFMREYPYHSIVEGAAMRYIYETGIGVSHLPEDVTAFTTIRLNNPSLQDLGLPERMVRRGWRRPYRLRGDVPYHPLT